MSRKKSKNALPKHLKPETLSDLRPQIATRAYELYGLRGRMDGGSVQDWDQAEREIREFKS